jgi:hypothetical protein
MDLINFMTFDQVIFDLSDFCKPGGLDLSRHDLDRDLDLDTEKKLVSTVEKISTVSKS